MSYSNPREDRWKKLIADRWLSIVLAYNFLVATAYAVYSNREQTFAIGSSLLKFQKHWFMYHVQTKLHPRTEIPLVSSLSRWRNSVSDELEANTEVHRALPFAHKSQTYHGMWGHT